MNDARSVRLKNGREMQITVLTYPIPISDQMTLIGLWQTEWDRTDVSWSQSMNGAYSQTLTIQSIVGKVEDVSAGTATVYYPCTDPEVCVVGSVLTHPDFRGRGIAEVLVNAVVQLGFDAGCQVSFLGSSHRPMPVYRRCGFDWHNGNVMRRAAPGFETCERRFFTEGQKTWIREAEWGDLPGMACFVSRPLDCLVLDYPRGLLSGKHVALTRCVSNFSAVWCDVAERGGAMCTLVGEAAHRMLGFATLTPGPGAHRRHKAVIDVIAHDSYEAGAPKMIQHLMAEAVRRDIDSVQAYVAAPDQKKLRWFEDAGMKRLAILPRQVRARGEMIDVAVLEAAVG